MTSRTDWTFLAMSILLALCLLQQRAMTLVDRVVRRFPKYEKQINIAFGGVGILVVMGLLLFIWWPPIVEEGVWRFIVGFALWVIIAQSAGVIAKRFPKYETHIENAGLGLGILAFVGCVILLP